MLKTMKPETKAKIDWVLNELAGLEEGELPVTSKQLWEQPGASDVFLNSSDVSLTIAQMFARGDCRRVVIPRTAEGAIWAYCSNFLYDFLPEAMRNRVQTARLPKPKKEKPRGIVVTNTFISGPVDEHTRRQIVEGIAAAAEKKEGDGITPERAAALAKQIISEAERGAQQNPVSVSEKLPPPSIESALNGLVSSIMVAVTELIDAQLRVVIEATAQKIDEKIQTAIKAATTNLDARLSEKRIEPLPAPKKKRRVIIAGILPGQINIIRQTLGDRLDLREITEYKPGIKDTVKFADNVISWIDHVSHPLDVECKSGNPNAYEQYRGGISKLTERLTEIANRP